MKQLFTHRKPSYLRLALILALVMITHSSCNHKSIRLIKKPTPEMPEGNQDKLFFQKFVAGKITEKLQTVLPDTLKSIEVAKLFPGEDLQNIVLEGGYSVGGIYFTRSQNENGDKDKNKTEINSAKITVHLRYNLRELFGFAKNQLTLELQQKGKISPELLEAISLSLEILEAYYTSVASIPLAGEIQTTLPHSNATTRQVFLTSLQIVYFQLIEDKQEGAHKRFKLQLRWNAEQFQEFLTGILAGKYKIEVVKQGEKK